MIDISNQINIADEGAYVMNYDVTCTACARNAAVSTENASPALGKKVAGGVGVSGRASDSGGAIYSQRKKISNAYGVEPQPARCRGLGCEICEAARKFAAKQNQSVCDSAQVSNSEAAV